MSEREIHEQQKNSGSPEEPASTAPTPSYPPESMTEHMTSACGCSPAVAEMMAACCGRAEGSKPPAADEQAAAGRD